MAAAGLTACGAPAQTVPGAVLPPAARGSRPPTTEINLAFQTLDDKPYTSFNELLGVSNGQRIVGYFGSGKRSDPTVAYYTHPPFQPNNYRNIQYPSATYTVATTINDRGTIAGYYVDPYKKTTFAFAYVDKLWYSYGNPHGRGAATHITGLNDDSMAVGFYKSGKDVGSFEMPLATGKFTPIDPPPGTGTDLYVTAINGHDDVVGYLTSPSGTTMGFVRKAASGKVRILGFPYAASTQFLSITVDDRIVGTFVDATGATHGFILQHPFFAGITWQQIDEPDAVGVTVPTGINKHNDIVGWYVDGHGTHHGFLATPK
jgi:hypothetical protein